MPRGSKSSSSIMATERVSTAVWCRTCQLVFGATRLSIIDGKADRPLLDRLLRDGFEATHKVNCPSCQTSHLAASPVLVHLPKALYILLPDGWHHDVLAIRGRALATIGRTVEGEIPGYLLDPKLADRASLANALDAPTPALRPDLPKLAPPQARVSEKIEAEESVDVVSVDIVAAEVAEPPKPSLLAGDYPAPPALPDPVVNDTDRWSAVDQGWTLENSDAPAEDEATHVVAIADISTPKPARSKAANATKSKPSKPTSERAKPAGPQFDAALAAGGDAYLNVQTSVGGKSSVHAVMRLSAERAESFEEGTAQVRMQLHITEAGPAIALTLVATETGGAIRDFVYWAIDPKKPGDAAALDCLAEAFVVDFRFHLLDGAYHGRRRFRVPLEQNVTGAREVVEVAEKAAAYDAGAALRGLAMPQDAFLGTLRHNFRQNSFATLESAADTRLALGIIGYWGEAERRDYLLQIQSFPVIWYTEILDRIVRAAVHFGIALDPNLRPRAVTLDLAESSKSLLKIQLANFAEVCLKLKPNGLDALDTWDNWEALLALAEELDIEVDAEIEELAVQSMDRAREAAQEGQPIEIDADDGSIIESEEINELGALSEVDLVGLLENRAKRVDAALRLIAKGQSIYVPALFDTIRVLTRAEMLRVVPAALSMGPSFQLSFVDGLRSKRASLRLASALFLAEIRSERATQPLLKLVAKAADGEWRVLARAAARMGRRILGATIKAVAAHPDASTRFAYTLALLGPDARGALSAARDKQKKKVVKRCLTEALSQVGKVSFGDPADFTERLADAFDVAGPDGLGPDFEESLESVELGPGAGIEGA